jgi:hypothetical protein
MMALRTWLKKFEAGWWLGEVLFKGKKKKKNPGMAATP